jgi:hypothetical protein
MASDIPPISLASKKHPPTEARLAKLKEDFFDGFKGQLVPFGKLPRFGVFLMLKPDAELRGALVYEKRDDATAWLYGHNGKDKTPPSQGGGRIIFKRGGEIQLDPRELVLPYEKG